MKNSTAPIKSFKALGLALHAQDVAAANRLRRAASLPAPKVGPKVAR